MLVRLRSKIEIATLGLQSWWKIAIGVLGAALGLITVSLEGPWWVVAIAFGLALVGSFVAWRDVMEARKHWESLYTFHSRPALLELNTSDTYDAFKDESWQGHRYLYDPALNAELDGLAAALSFQGSYVLPPNMTKLLQHYLLAEESRRGKILVNQAKVRLASDLTLSSIRAGDVMRVQATNYFASVCTNESTDKEVRVKETNEPALRGIHLCSEAGVLLDLVQSPASNHIGISTLALTSDGFLLTTVQAKGSAKYANRVAPSGSGSADMTDLDGAEKLRDLVIGAMERELHEECSVDVEGGAARTVLLGYARIVERGGKPEFFGFTKLSSPRSSAKVSSEEAMYVADARGHRMDRRKLAGSLADFRAREEHSFTPTMHIALQMLQEALDAGQPAVMALLEP